MQTKHCARCSTDRPIDQFATDRSRKDGKFLVCRPCHKVYNDATRERRSAQKKSAYRQNPEQARSRANAYRIANPERVAARKAAAFSAMTDAEKAVHYEALREWKRNNPGKIAANTRARQAAKIRATPAWADLGKVAAFYEAAVLANRALGIEHHVDHIVPLRSKTVCGLHNEFNLQILTAETNVLKNNRTWPGKP